MMRKIAQVLCLCLVLLGFSLPAQNQTRRTWDGTSRFNVLVMGMDRRPGARDTLSVRTDLLLLVSFDPAAGSIGVLHIPRDTHMTPRSRSSAVRVNTLLVEGEKILPGYGPAYAMDTLHYTLGMRVHAYIAFDFEAFIKIVDTIGGIEVDVPYVINDLLFPDMNYGYDPLFLPSGLNHMDGRTALKYVRTRHGDSDYERGQRQLQVLIAVRDKILQTGTMPVLIGKSKDLLEQLANNMYTNITYEEGLRLGLYALSVGKKQIATGSIDREYSQESKGEDGSSILVPNPLRLPELLTRVFGFGYS